MKLKIIKLLMLSFFIGIYPAHAYIGPGLGVGAIGAILGVIGSILVAIFAILWYPIKRMIKRKKKQIEENIGERS